MYAPLVERVLPKVQPCVVTGYATLLWFTSKVHAHACNVQLDSYHDIYLQLLEECQLENLAAEVVKHNRV